MKAIEQVIPTSRKTHCKLHKYKTGGSGGWQSQAGRLCLHIHPADDARLEDKRPHRRVCPKPQLSQGHFPKIQHASLSLFEVVKSYNIPIKVN